MLNLKELEKKLDEALDKETNESLTEWLMLQRIPTIESFLGNGCLVSMEGLYLSLDIKTITKVNVIDQEYHGSEVNQEQLLAA